MSRTRPTSRRTHRSKAVPVLGAAGLSLTLASGASFANPTPSLDSLTRNGAGNCEITLREEEVFDQSLATFHVFDNESARRAGERLMTFGGGGCCQFACLAGKAAPVPKAHPRWALMRIRARLAPSGQRINTFGEGRKLMPEKL
jgi:hypothetical protein